jgi:lipopolysaccharide transport system ATP-binding protein
MSTAISVEQLSKRYLLNHQSNERNTTLRDAIAHQARRFTSIFRPKDGSATRASTEEFWALRDVAFDIKQGDRVGIIGRNGAGKSTLLKLLSRITEPTRGSISIKGRVASLLEVGTGFHPELSGRENIFLNGAILGMSKEEIRRKFDEIVAFAEVERFLDTPVKRYSSGMYVRLAFAVAAHLEPEILIVDEVLAVGDANFQKKCLGRMEAVGRDGRTVLFVSHNMNAVEQLCNAALLFDSGHLIDEGHDIRKLIAEYLHANDHTEGLAEWTAADATYDTEWFAPTRFAITDAHGTVLSMPIASDADAWVRIEGDIGTIDAALQIGYALFTDEGKPLYCTLHTDVEEAAWPKPVLGGNVFRSRLPQRFLNEGTYRIELMTSLYYRTWITQPGVKAPRLNFQIEGGFSDSPYWMTRRAGDVAPVIEWRANR